MPTIEETATVAAAQQKSNGEVAKRGDAAAQVEPKPKKATTKKKKRKKPTPKQSTRTAANRPYPAAAFEDSLQLASAFHELAERRVRRLTLFDHMQKAPDSGPSRQLITNSNKYGLTTGSAKAEYLELTDEGFAATDPDAAPPDRMRARFRLAIERIELFKIMYERFNGNKLPAPAVLRDFLVDECSVESEDADRVIEIFTLNAKFVGLLKTISGAERVVSIEHALDDLPKGPRGAEHTVVSVSAAPRTRATSPSPKSLDHVCFYASPIGDEGSEHRQHADLFQASLVEPAMEKLGLQVVRADAISESGMISAQVLEHIRDCRLMVADLSFLNANVFYEMALRHARRLPIIQLIRKADALPFDVNQVRTIVIDTTSIYALVPRLNSHITEITNHARAALENPENTSNPVTVFCPTFWG